jgi:hypothetical protein
MNNSHCTYIIIASGAAEGLGVINILIVFRVDWGFSGALVIRGQGMLFLVSIWNGPGSCVYQRPQTMGR